MKRKKVLTWSWGGKSYRGEEIPSRETSTHKFARTNSGKVKKIPKKKKS